MTLICHARAAPTGSKAASAALSLALISCTPSNDERLFEIQRLADAVCAAGQDLVPAAQMFEREARVCYAYETVQDRPPGTMPHWTDKDRIRGEGRDGWRTFDLATTMISSSHGTLVQFHGAEFDCLAVEQLVIGRDRSAEALSDGATSCHLRVVTPAQVESDLAMSSRALAMRENPQPPIPPRPRVPRLIQPNP